MPILNYLNRKEAEKKAAQAPYRLLESETKFSYGDKKAKRNFLTAIKIRQTC